MRYRPLLTLTLITALCLAFVVSVHAEFVYLPLIGRSSVQEAACGDGRAVITGPRTGQVVNGVVDVFGTARHESFQYYKLEYAPGAWAVGGYIYFAGGNSQVIGGLLGNFDSSVLPNGDYTIRLVVVDQTGNYPPPCYVAIVVQN